MRHLLGPGGLGFTLACSSAATVGWAVAGAGVGPGG